MKVRTKNPNLKVLVLVPTEALKLQWIEELQKQDAIFNTEVKVMMGASSKQYVCDMLILDECHRISAEKISNVFKVVKFKLILGLTATFERLDGRHAILAKYAPVCDEIPIEVASLNGWVSKYKDYVVVLEVDDIDIYKGYNKEFVRNFEFFDFNWNLVMSMLGKDGFKRRKEYCNQICKNPDKWKDTFKAITLHAMGFMKAMQKRKAFIANHPKKLEIAKKIIEARKDKKIITFCPSVKIAESFGNGYVCTGKQGKKKNRMTLNEFALADSGILHSCKMLDEGLSIGNLEVGIMLNVNSSKTKAIQTLGRVIRVHGNKVAEFFTIIIKDTVETQWMSNSRSSTNYELIDEEALNHILRNEPYEPYKRKLKQLNLRF